MQRLLVALEDLKQTVLPKDPRLFATMAEAPLDDLAKIRDEISRHLSALKRTG